MKVGIMRVGMLRAGLAFVVAIGTIAGAGGATNAQPTLASSVASASTTDWIEPIPAGPTAPIDYGVRSAADYLRGVSNDGGTVLVASRSTIGRTLDLEVATRGIGNRARLIDVDPAHRADAGAISGDGRTVAYYGSAGTQRVLRLWTPATGDVRTVASVNTQWFPDLLSLSTTGRYLFYVQPTTSTEGELHRLDVATGADSIVGFGAGMPSITDVEISSDGRYVVYRVSTASGATIVRQRVSSGAEETIAELDLDQARRGSHLGISGNGRYIAYAGFWTDTATGRTVEFSADFPRPHDQATTQVSINANGVVAYATTAQPDPLDASHNVDIYTWDPRDGAYRLVSISDLGTALTGHSHAVLLPDAGDLALFQTTSHAHRYRRADPSAVFYRSLRAHPTDAGVVAGAVRPQTFRINAGVGYWTVDAAGIVRGYRDAVVFPWVSPATGAHHERPPLVDDEEVTSMSATRFGDGYWLFTNLGRVFAYGSAHHYGDMSGVALAGAIVDSAATVTGGGYYMLGADGGVFTFGDAVYHESIPEILPGVVLNEPVVAFAPSSSGRGYRMVAADGGVFNFGDAAYYGSVPEVLPGVQLQGPIVGVVSARDGYLNVASDGGIFNFGASPFHGSLGANPPSVPVSAVLVLDGTNNYHPTGYVMVDRNGNRYMFGYASTIFG